MKQNRKNILVTGSAGFIGSSFVDYSISIGYEVIGIDDMSYGKAININKKSRFIELDVRNYKKLESIIVYEKPIHIIHFAADPTTKTSSMGWNDPFTDNQINLIGTLNILEIIKNNKIDAHFIYASSAAVYGEPLKIPISELHQTNPISPYGISKLAGEKYCYAYSKEWGLKVTIFRIFNTFGPRQTRYVMYDQIKNIITNHDKIQILGTGEQIRDYCYVTDTVNAFALAMNNKNAIGEIFNIGGGNRIKIRELIKQLKKQLNIYPEEIYTGNSWKGDINELWADTRKIRNMLGWKPKVSLEEGISFFIEWFQYER